MTSSAPEKQNEYELDDRSDRQTNYLSIHMYRQSFVAKKSLYGGGGIETTSILSFKVPIIKQGVRLLTFTLSLLGFFTGHLGRGYA